MNAAPVREKADEAFAFGEKERGMELGFHPAAARARRANRLSRLSARARKWMTGIAFAMFFGASLFIGLFGASIFLVRAFVRKLRRTSPELEAERRELFTKSLNTQMRLFTGFVRDLGLIDHWAPVLPDGYEERPFLLIANHPSLFDVVLILSAFPQVSCVAKAGWYNSMVMGPLLRSTHYVPGPGFQGEEAQVEGDPPMLKRLEASLREGVPVLVFPEGTRSSPESLRRFKRGAIEAAIRAEVPILGLFVSTNPAYLMKGDAWHDVPKTPCAYDFDWLDPIETKGRQLDSRQLTREIAAAYEKRWQQLLGERRIIDEAVDAGELPPFQPF